MKRLICILTTLILLLSLCSLTPSAAARLTECVSILNPKQNISGEGYQWQNKTDTLVLTGLNIVTEDDFGLRICDGATVVLEGKNYIKASKAAVYLEGNVIFKGNGSLTVVGGEYGILCCSPKTEHKMTVTGGTYSVTGGIDGIHSDHQKVAFSGGNVTVTGTKGCAINAYELQTGNNVTIKATGSLRASYRMQLQASNLKVESKEAALQSGGILKLEHMTLKAGSNLESLTAVETYGNEAALATVSTFDTSRRSILFGDKVPFAVDVILLIAVLLLLAAVIVLPILHKQHQAKLAIAARDEAEAERKRQKKLNKKSQKG